VAGVGLRSQHHQQVLKTRPRLGWVEVHSENFFADGGPQLELLYRVRADYPLSCHGVGLSLGSADPLDLTHLRLLKRLVDRFQPALVSEHCCWVSVNGTFLNDLLPLPYTEEALDHMIRRVGQVQDVLGRQILIENPSSYLEFNHSTIREWDFLAQLAGQSGCGLLVDVNNIYVSSRNNGFDPYDYLQHIPPHHVGEIHLAGFSINRYGEREILIDTHSARVWPAVWDLYEAAVRRFGPVPTLIEWDTDLPDLDTLIAEARHADALMEGAHALVA
jgi:hypothetical protein